MTHPHIIIDDDPNFIIDPLSRRVISQSDEVTKLAQYDHNSERITFMIPRIVEGHDMDLVDTIYIHYINKSDSVPSLFNFDIYQSTDLVLFEDEKGNEFARFSWLVSNNATRYCGPITFTIRFECHEEGEPIYIWNTAVCSSIRVIPSFDNGPVVIDEYSDVINQWRAMLNSDVYNFKAEILSSLTTPSTWPQIPDNELGAARVHMGIVTLSQSEYDALAEKNPNVLYLITEDA